MVRYFRYYLMLMTALAALALLAGMSAVSAFEGDAARYSGVGAISIADLPKEARDTLALIRKGGPFPYSKDGTVFSNRERILAKQPRGYYHEYTVKTPGSRDRGARRIICGGKQQQECYYTADHYRTFKAIKE